MTDCTTCIARREISTCAYRPGSVEQGDQQHNLQNISRVSLNGRDIAVVDDTNADVPLPQAVDWNGNAITRPPSQPSEWNASASVQGPSPAQGSTGSISGNAVAIQRSDAGFSSSGGFIRTILGPNSGDDFRTAAGSRRAPGARLLTDLGTREMSSTRNPQLTNGEYTHLPPRREANRLLQSYRKTHYPIFPLLDLPSLFAEVDALYQGVPQTTDETTLLCVLNFIFALAVQTDGLDSSHAARDLTEPYVDRGRKLMSTDMLEGYSFAQLQSILLCAQFLLSTDKPQQCWVLVGLSVRIAESLGLDRPSTAEQLKSPTDQALVRRIWHVCVAMDRLVAMCLGQRPTSNTYATAFVGLDIDHSARTQSAPFHDLPSSHSFFAESSKLFDVLYSILLQIYVPEDRNPSEKMTITASFATTVLDLEDKLANWVEQLPIELRLRDSDRDSQLVCVQPAHFLRQR
jgi:hypothetical protein